MAVSGDTFVVGAPVSTTFGRPAGSAYVFDLSVPPVFVPSFSVNDALVVEGDAGRRTARFTISLSGPPTGTVSVDVATEKGSARPTDDKPRMTALSFAPGQETAIFDVKVKGDTLVEPDETFRVRLDQAKGASITNAVGLGTIVS